MSMNQTQFTLSIDISCDLPTIFPLMVKTHTKPQPTNQILLTHSSIQQKHAKCNANTEEEGEEWKSDC
jgi:hypothetical protein